MAKKKQQKKIGKINRFLYFLVYIFLYPYYKIRYGITVDNRVLKGEKGPALVIAPHTSNKDHWLVSFALYPIRPTYVISEHFFAKPKLRPILRLAHCISKKMFCPDVSTIMNILRAKREGNTVVLFPEGRLTCNGRTGHLSEGTATLAKKLGVNVYCITANGASCTFPKWGKTPRRGKIRIVAEQLITAEEVATLSEAEIETRMQNAIRHDDMAAMAGVRYKSKRMAEGLDGILYRCPACKSEFRMNTKGNRIFCTACEFSAMLDETYRLHGGPHETILSWYDWQASLVDIEVDALETDAVIGAVDGQGNMCKTAGRAHLTINKTDFVFDGTVFDKPVSFTRRCESVTAFPITVGEEFDIYQNNVLYYMYPQPDNRAAVKWVAYLDAVTDARLAEKTDITL